MSETTQGEVTIRSYRLVRDFLGAKEVSQPIPSEGTVESLLEAVGADHDVEPDDFLVMVNGRNIKQLEGLETNLSDGDSLTLSLGSVPE